MQPWAPASVALCGYSLRSAGPWMLSTLGPGKVSSCFKALNANAAGSGPVGYGCCAGSSCLGPSVSSGRGASLLTSVNWMLMAKG